MTTPLTRWLLALGVAAVVMGLLLVHAAAAQEIEGVWHGAINAPTGELRLVVKVQRDAGGGFSGEMLSPDQGSSALPISDIRMAHERFSFEAPQIHGRFEGHWEAARHAWVGEWTQGTSLPLTLEAGDLAPGKVIKGLDGRWEGAVTLPNGAKLRLVLRVATGPYGTIAALDSPDQLAYGIRIGGLSLDDGVLTFTVASVEGAYSGVIGPDGKTINGEWTQRAEARPLNFQRVTAKAAAARPQTPKPPFPYRSEEVSVPSAPGVTLAGTLTLPPGKGPFPAAFLITGSGAQDRDETILGHKPFAVLADYLTRRGIAVLRVDDRGFGKSTGDFATATEADFVTDAQAAVRWLRQRPEIDPRKVGLIGHSEGGIIGPMVAASDPKIAFVVMMAGPGAPMSDVLTAQRIALGPSMGVDGKTLEKINAAVTQELAAMKGAKDAAEAKARAIAVLKAEFPKLPAPALEAQAAQVSSDWFRSLMAYDPGPTLRRLKLPVLALVGSKDRQVPAAQNIPALREALKNDRNATVIELPGLNHLFQTAPTGALGEYADIEETIAPSALKTIGDWVVNVTKR